MNLKSVGRTVGHGLRIGLRQHRRQRAFALTVAATLAGTIGATAAVFALVNTIVLRGLPYEAPDRLVWVASVRPDNPMAPFTLPEYMDYRDRTRTLAGLAAYASWSASLAGDGVTERLTGSRMSANAFDVIGARPAAGRLLTPADDDPAAPAVVVISHRLWQRRFGGDPAIAGTIVRINGAPYTIAGVMSRHFPFPLADIDVVAPLVPERDPLRHERNSVNFLRFFGRLRDGVTVEQARAELSTISQALRQQFPVEYARKQAVNAVPLRDAIVGQIRPSLLRLLAAVVVVLATALANLLSLALVRGNARRGELSMRMALGASRARLAVQLGAESWLLAIAGGGAGWVVAGWIIAATRAFGPASIPRLGEVSLDAPAATVTIAVTIVATLLLTAAQGGAAVMARAGDALRSGSRGAIGDRWNSRLRHVMVASEIAVALVLVLATIGLVGHLLQLENVRPGFNPEGVFQARVSIPPAYRSPDDVARFYERLSERLREAPGVRSVGVISVAPLTGLLATVPFSVATESTSERDRTQANLRAISAGYIATVGTQLVEGRTFGETDTTRTPPVALVSRALANRFLPAGAVGQRLLINDNNVGPRPVQIVGVVENVRHTALDLPATLDIYLPITQLHQDRVGQVRDNQFWMVKTSASDPATFSQTFAAALRAVDADAAVSAPGSMHALLDNWLGPRRFNLGVFSVFALSALALAVIGLSGLASYAVSQRSAEIGLRMAIGATPGQVQWMVLRQAGRLGVTGVGLGLALAAVGRTLTAGIMQDSVGGSSIVAVAAGLMLAIVMIAAWLPARRAARIDPIIALRTE